MLLRLFFRNARIRIKSGEKEIEFEGPLSFIKNDLLNFVNRAKGVPSQVENEGASAAQGADGGLPQQLNYDIIAEKFLAHKRKTSKKKEVKLEGKDIVLCLAAKLHFVDGKASFSYDAIHEEAKNKMPPFPKVFVDGFKVYFDRLSQNKTKGKIKPKTKPRAKEIELLSNGEFALTEKQQIKFREILS